MPVRKYDPTRMSSPRTPAIRADDPRYNRRQAAKYLNVKPQTLAAWANSGFTAGVKIAYGTDAAVYPHGDNGKEFAVLVRRGMSPIEAIRSATIHSAPSS